MNHFKLLLKLYPTKAAIFKKPDNKGLTTTRAAAPYVESKNYLLFSHC